MRRTVDIVAAATGLILLAPVLVLVGLAIRVSMGSPILFRQRRSGRNGEEFDICKFRTMRAERYPGEADLDRTHALGRMLRTYSVDELPQLWNVLCGQMSLIGPRPTLPEQVARYNAHQRRRLEIRPGLTGYAQVKGRNTLSWPERIELDIWYIDHRRPSLDLRIIAGTVTSLLRPHGITGEAGINPDFPAAREDG